MTSDDSVTAKLLDFSQDPQTYVQYLDNVVDTFYQTSDKAQQTQARTAIEALQAHPSAWERVDTILQHSKSEQSKFVALQILEETIKTRWNVLPEDQQKGIRQFLSNVIISVATSNEYAKHRVYLHKLNLVLVQVLKKDWPARWPNFIPELVGASKTSENLCENSMHILRLLSEEVFDFNRGELTQSKTRQLKAQLNSEFQSIHELCHFVLRSTDLWSSRPALVKATLSALQFWRTQVYLTWIPLAYIFNTNLLEILLGLFPRPPFRNLALQCLTEIGSLPEVGQDSEHNEMYLLLFQHFMGALVQVLPPTLDIAQAYEQGSEEDELFVHNLALFLTSFLREHLMLIETSPTTNLRTQLTLALQYLVKISYVQNSEVFKVCLDYWNKFVPDVFTTVHQYRGGTDPITAAMFSTGTGTHPRVVLYDGVLKGLRLLMIERMVKPEEVLITADEHGNVVRDVFRDTDALQQYKTMRETLVYLSHLDYANTEEQMLEKLRLQLNGNLQWDRLNTLCWAIGSISGSMEERQENQFLVTVIRDLLNLCEVTLGKDNKAVIASNIMYVVGQYPRFLRAHWKFLKTVVNKLFEFMHELHPGVQDMAVETLLKICNKCKRKFVVLHPTETQPFVAELLATLPETIKDLKTHQVNMFYESVALMIRAETNEALRNQYLTQRKDLSAVLQERLMELPMHTWNRCMELVGANEAEFGSLQLQQQLHNVLLSHVSVCQSMGGFFLPQMVKIFTTMLGVYAKYSALVNSGIQAAGPLGAQHSAIKSMRSVKKVTLKLVETFVDTSETQEHLSVIAQQFVPALMEPILSDYAQSVADAKEAEVLSMFAMIINKLKDAMAAHVPTIFAATFECTLDMIKGNYVDFPEHRLQFFSLLQAITNHCFATLRGMSSSQQGLLIDSIVWAFRHTERNVADTGLQLLADMLNRFTQERELMGPFLQAYYLRLMQEIFAVLTDTMHKPGFRLQVKILSQLIGVVKNNVVPVPLWPEGQNHASNAEFVRGHLINMLATSFPNMTQPQVQNVVDKMFDLVDDYALFKDHCRDFLVQTKEFGSANNDELYAEEKAREDAARAAQVPGLIKPEHVDEEDAMGQA